ncbi:MAG: SRPBCC family protein [Actinomycetota bacterium]|nr:SRPBCC family protein [Actinomycetota bacterium]
MTVEGMYHEKSIQIDATAEQVYDTVSDLTRMGEWSPENCGGRWLDGGAGAVGDRFEGDNQLGDRKWSVVAQVTRADRGSEFQFVTGEPTSPYVRWTYRMNGSSPTVLTEIWDVEQLPPTLASADAERLAARAQAVGEGMVATLAAIRSTLES